MTFKRIFDIVGAGAGLLVFAPVMALVIIAVLVDDGRPVLFCQPRLGLRRRPCSIRNGSSSGRFEFSESRPSNPVQSWPHGVNGRSAPVVIP